MQEVNAYETILTQLREDFIESSKDRLTEIDDLISAMMNGGDTSEILSDFLRHIHSLKGTGGSFDFAFVTTVSHKLEDYIETAPVLEQRQFKDIQVFVDHIRDTIEAKNDPPEDEIDRIISTLPVTAVEFTEQPSLKDIGILLVLPKGLQRTIVGKELAACGFHISNADRPTEALASAVVNPPDIIVVSQVMAEMNGVEFSNVLKQIDSTKNCRVIIATSTDTIGASVMNLPAGTAIVRKGKMFSDDLTSCLIDWGFFGDIGLKRSSAS
jgi:PleD family two-component response regulator